MVSRDENFYAAWRENRNPLNTFQDRDTVPPEKWLQAVWLQQRLQRDQLKTTDGQTVRVLHPGFLSREGGPDFQGAVLQFAGNAPTTGDVEVDLHPGGWRAHGHDRNPRFRNVILHVVWEASDKGTSQPPILTLKNRLDSPLELLELALDQTPALPAFAQGQCSAPLRQLAAPQLDELLRAAAQIRLENKARAMLIRAKAAGWEQTLWEHLFRALGYKHNIWPMRLLAESKSQWFAAGDSPFTLQARLLGIGGLLPEELSSSQKNSNSFLRRAWNLWWRERDTLADCLLPRSVWHVHGLRPANHPQRRLALAAHWLAAGNLPAQIEAWIAADLPAGKRGSTSRPAAKATPPVKQRPWLDSLHKVLQVPPDDFWSWHWTFKSCQLTKPRPLLGTARVTDLAVNVILPWLWIRAREGANPSLTREVEQRFFAWPAAEDNAVLKLARQRLLGNASARAFSRAAQQQGLMQITRDFCDHSNAVCADCPFPERVRSRGTPPINSQEYNKAATLP